MTYRDVEMLQICQSAPNGPNGQFYYILQKFNGLKELTPLSKVEN